MAYRRTIAQRDLRLKRVRHFAQALTVAAGLGGGLGVGYLAQASTPAGTAATTTTVGPASTHVVAPKAPASATSPVKVPATAPAKVPAKAVAPVVKTSTPVAAPAARQAVCVTSPSGTVTCH